MAKAAPTTELNRPEAKPARTIRLEVETRQHQLETRLTTSDSVFLGYVDPQCDLRSLYGTGESVSSSVEGHSFAHADQK